MSRPIPSWSGLYEIVDGKLSLTGPSRELLGKNRLLVSKYFSYSESRFKSLDLEKVAAL